MYFSKNIFIKTEKIKLTLLVFFIKYYILYLLFIKYYILYLLFICSKIELFVNKNLSNNIIDSKVINNTYKYE